MMIFRFDVPGVLRRRGVVVLVCHLSSVARQSLV
jgi:hypothetical protein